MLRRCLLALLPLCGWTRYTSDMEVITLQSGSAGNCVFVIESNYDNDMLRIGPYPQNLKDRISGKRGHISNKDAAELLDACDANQLQWACLGHLSAKNNSPEVAIATHRERHGDRFQLFCADRDGALQLPKVKEPIFSLRAKASSV